MAYLHEEIINERLVRHWANDVEELDPEDEEEYKEAVYKIKQIETDILYSDTYDVLPCRYTYEIATDEHGGPILIYEEPIIDETDKE